MRPLGAKIPMYCTFKDGRQMRMFLLLTYFAVPKAIHAAIMQKVVRVGCTKTLLWFGCPCLRRGIFIMPWWGHRYPREGLCSTFASVAWTCSFWLKVMVLSPGHVWRRRHLHHCHLKNLVVGTLVPSLKAVWRRTATTRMDGWQPTRRF